MSESESPDTPHVCTGPCQKKKPAIAEISAGAALLGLALGAMVGCDPTPPGQPLYGVPADDDDSAIGDDDDASGDDDDSGVLG